MTDGPPSYGQYGPPAGQLPGWTGTGAAPGGVPLRPLGLGDILSGTFTLIRQNPPATIGLVAIGTLTGAILAIVLGLIARGSGIGEAFADIPAFLLDAAVGGGVLAALGRALLGRKISISEALRQSRAGWVLLTAVIYWLIVVAVWTVPLVVLHGFGVLIAFPLGAWLGIMLCLMFPVVVLERQSPIAAIGRSWQLVRGSFWRYFGVFALLIIVMFVMFFIVDLIIALAGVAGFAALHGHGVVSGSAAAIGGIVAIAVLYFVLSSVVTALWTAVIVLLYADARMRKEGMDLVLQQAAQNQQLTGDEFAANILT